MGVARSSPDADGAFWYLEGYVDPDRRSWRTVIRSLPMRVGRSSKADLCLYSDAVSHRQAELYLEGGELWIRDLGSTNGTFVNARQLTAPRRLEEGDTIHFADLEFRFSRYRPPGETDRTATRVLDTEELSDYLLGLSQAFEELLRRRAVRPFFQAVKELDGPAIKGYEILARGNLEGFETMPQELFFIGEQLGLEGELSRLCREIGMAAASTATGSPVFFVNTHPNELNDPGAFVESLRGLRREIPQVRMAIEIHEAAVTDPVVMRELRLALAPLGIELAFDDFGTGRSRLLEIGEVPPDYLKFDMGLIRNLHLATRERTRLLSGLVETARSIGITPIAEGVETRVEADACRAVGFEYAQGFYFALPGPELTPPTS